MLIYFIFRRRKWRENAGGVLIVFGSTIGDSLLFADALMELDIFYKRKGEKVVFVCNAVVERFLKSVRKDITVVFRSFDSDRILSDYAYFKKFIDDLNNVNYKLLIAPLQAKRADLISLNIQADVKLGMYSAIRSKFSGAYWLKKLAYTESIITPSGDFVLKNYRKLFNYLKDKFPHYQLTPLPILESKYNFSNGKHYCVVCPTASEPAKIWELNKFCRIIDHITEQTGLDIYICAGKESVELFAKMTSLVKHSEKLHDYVGKTSFVDWVELIRNARFCFGNDSASVHIAAFTGTKYIALTSGHFHGLCLPYDLGELDIEKGLIASPVCIYPERDCLGCYVIDGKRCAGNKKCKKNVKKNGRFLCIEEISVDIAIKVLDEVFLSLNLVSVE
jgi:ADP-heptose:LPS heptosyltransferase